MYRLKIISVGKMKKGYWLEALGHYEKMLRTQVRIDAVTVKDCSHLQGGDRKLQESGLIMQKLTSKDRLIALSEHGVLRDSPSFAAFLRGQLEDASGECCFVIGGAYGLSAELLAAAKTTVSLSPLTMPHELAHVVLYEQIFRAMTIIQNRTYHY